jgi:hypothetical protein
MYPKNATELAALIAALLPFTIWMVSGLRAVWTRAAEVRQQEWRRLSELAQLLYNKDYHTGMWAQIAAINELADVRGKNQVVAAKTILEQVLQQFGDLPVIKEQTEAALTRLRHKTWFGA